MALLNPLFVTVEVANILLAAGTLYVRNGKEVALLEMGVEVEASGDAETLNEAGLIWEKSKLGLGCVLVERI